MDGKLSRLKVLCYHQIAAPGAQVKTDGGKIYSNVTEGKKIG
jgi:hypothetical protein